MRVESTSLLKIAFIAYVVYLTGLLLVDDPTRLVGGHGTAPSSLRGLMPIAHLLSFSVLAALGFAAKWPLRPWILAAVLIAYGGATEIIQGFLPPRTPDWEDWFQDSAGVLLGMGVYWAIQLIYQRERSQN